MRPDRALGLASLLSVLIAFGGLLLTGQVPGAVGALGLAALALGAARFAGLLPDWGPFLLSRSVWNATLLGLCALLLVDLLWVTRDPLLSGVYLLGGLMVAKCFMLRERADFAHLQAISFLQLLACAALTVELWYGVVFILYLLTAVWALLLGHLAGEPGPPPAAGGASARPARSPLTPAFFWTTNGVAAGTLGLTLVLFFVTPRVGAGFFQKSRVEAIRTTGFSGKVDLGEIGSIKQDDTVVMRVVLPEHQAPVEGRLYFRGAAFDVYNGRAWVNSLSAQHQLERSPSGAFMVPGEGGRDLARGGLRQEVLLEVLDTTVLFAASFVETVEGGFPALQRDGMGSLHLPYPPVTRFQYRVYSIPDRIAPEDRTATTPASPGPTAGRFLQLPPMGPRVAELTADVSRSAPTVLGKVRAVERFLRANYRYTLDTGEGEGGAPLETFLFDRKSGYCEHYATAMVVMLRTLGIPARLVTGFLPGEWNDFGRYYTVRQKDAHAWVEVYFPRSGWVSFDPTPSLGAEAGDLYATVIGRLVDSLRLKWDRIVIQYSLRDQAAVARGLRERGEGVGRRLSAWLTEVARWAGQDWRETVRRVWALGQDVGAALALAAVGAGLWLLIVRGWRHLRARRPGGGASEHAAVVRLYAAMLRGLEARGFPKAPGSTPLEFARSVSDRWAAAGAFVGPLTDLYCRARFGGEPLSAEERRRARRLLADLRAARR
jgi:transglutaminase-like putative cysteine protease